MTRNQRSVLITTCTSHSLIHVYELSVPALLWLIQSEFGTDDLQMGAVATAYALLFGLGALPAGWLVDRLGSKALLLGCLWGGSAAMVGMALSRSVTAFAASACAMGLALSIYHPAGTALITHAVTPTGRVLAAHGMAGNLGVAGASVIAGVLGALGGWRLAVGSLAFVGFGLGARVLLLPAPEPREIRSRPGQGDRTSFALLLVATTFMGMVYRGLTTFLPKFFAVSYSDDASAGTALGGALTTVALLVGLAGMYVAGRLIDGGTHPARVFLVGALLQGPFLLLIGVSSGSPLVPLFMGVAFFHFFTQPAGNRLVADFTPPRLRGLGYGIYFLMTFGAGSLGASAGGWVSKHVGLRAAFPALAGFLVPPVLVMALLVWVLRRSRAAPAATEPPVVTLP
jgi:MFS family permease